MSEQPEPRGEESWTPADARRRQATDAEARALASGLRLRILRLCLDEPLTNREIAESLDLNPGTTLHHVRTLADTGFLRADEVRRGRRGSREIPYRTTGKSWYVSVDSGVRSMVDAWLSEIEGLDEQDLGMTRLGLRLPEDQMAEFRDRLYALLSEFHDRPRDPSAAPWSVLVSVHPDTSTPRRTGAGAGPLDPPGPAQ